ncbi:hypothetical protein LIER_22623 [Lithospermum erythrorhizon]|uniref:Uncharacterized protein n=1 Tax=Lithospermum erythrorhizon TaxID=34254 RepID=A0AAV3QUJ8_LITER
MKILPCTLFPCIAQEEDNLDEFQSKNMHSESSCSSHCSTLSSLPSMPSIPSLTPSSHHHEQPPSAAANHHCLATLKGHSSYIFSLALTGKHLYTGSSNSDIRLLSRDPLNNQENPTNKIVAKGKSAVKSIVIMGDKLFSAHQDHKIRVWRINSSTPDQKMKCISTLPTINDRCMKLFLPKNYVEVRRNKKCTYVNHVDTVSALAISSDGTCLYSASWDRSFKIWNISDFKCLESVHNAHEDAINSIVVSNDGLVYTGSADKKIKVWKKVEGEKKHKLVATLEKHKSAVNALALSVDGLVLYSGACDRSIIVWGKGDGGGGGFMVVVGALRGHNKAILCLCVVSELVFSGSADKTIRVWRKGVGKSYACLAVLEGHTKPIKCLVATVDSGHFDNSYLVYSGGLDCDIRIWRIQLTSI